MNKGTFYKTLNNLVAKEILTNEETYIINDYISELELEITRLNNIINELEKWLNEVIDDEDITRMELAVCQTILRKLKELKEKE